MSRAAASPSSSRPQRRRTSRFISLDAITLADLEIDPARAASQRLAELQAHAVWRRAVGEGLRSRARVGAWHDGTLSIDVPDAAWKRELEQLEPALLERVRACAQGIRVARLVFRIRSAAVAAIPAAARRRADRRDAPDAAADTADLGEALALIPDEGLRGRLWQVAGRCLARRRL